MAMTGFGLFPKDLTIAPGNSSMKLGGTAVEDQLRFIIKLTPYVRWFVISEGHPFGGILALTEEFHF